MILDLTVAFAGGVAKDVDCWVLWLGVGSYDSGEGCSSCDDLCAVEYLADDSAPEYVAV